MAMLQPVENMKYAVCTDDLDNYGYVLAYDPANAGQVKLFDTKAVIENASPALGDVIAGIAYKSTEDVFNLGTYLTEVPVAYISQQGAICDVILDSDGTTPFRVADIAVGDILWVPDSPTIEGSVDKYTRPTVAASPTTAEILDILEAGLAIVGVAQEAVLTTEEPDHIETRIQFRHIC